jgi:hypothetical protein
MAALLPAESRFQGGGRLRVGFQDTQESFLIAPGEESFLVTVHDFLGPFKQMGEREAGKGLSGNGCGTLEKFLLLRRKPHFQAIRLGRQGVPPVRLWTVHSVRPVAVQVKADRSLLVEKARESKLQS